jgi:hypothetical protein
MFNQKNMNTRGIVWLPLLIIIVSALLVAMVGYAFFTELGTDSSNTTNTSLLNRGTGVICTMEARSCPDGSSVGRIPPNCEFAACPNANTNSAANINSAVNTNSATNTNSVVNSNSSTNTNTAVVDPSDWKTYTNSEYGLTFQYPSTLTATLGHTEFGEDTFQHLNFSDSNKTYGYWMTFRAASGYSDPLTAFIELQGFSADLSDTLDPRDDLVIDGLIAKNYCGVPGNSAYCSAFLLINGNIYLFNYHENNIHYPESDIFPPDILATIRFTD